MPTVYQAVFEALSAVDRDNDQTRWDHVANKSFAIPTDADVAFIGARAGRQGFVEVGAGWGYWSSELRLAGHTVRRISDIEPPAPGQIWKYAEPSPTRNDALNSYWVEEVVEEAAAVTWDGQRNRAVLAVCPDFGFDGISAYSGDRVIVVQEDTVSDPTQYAPHAPALLADGWAIVEQYDLPLSWPRYECRLEVWERV